MTTLLIIYDIRRKRTYRRIWAAIKKLGIARRVQFSCWHVRSRCDAIQARDSLQRVLEAGDALMVIDARTTASNEAIYEHVDSDQQQLDLRDAA